MELSPSGVLRFGVFQANLAAREIRKHGVRVRLPGQPFFILSILLEKPGEVITREEIKQKIWPADTFVDFEHSLNTAIKKLRQALGDNAARPKYIETLTRRGYRFRGKVEVSGEKTGASVGVSVARPGQLAGKVFTLEAEKGIPCVMAPMDESCRKEWERLQSLEDDVGIAVMIAEKRLMLVEGGHRVRVLAAEDRAQWCEVRI